MKDSTVKVSMKLAPENMCARPVKMSKDELWIIIYDSFMKCVHLKQGSIEN